MGTAINHAAAVRRLEALFGDVRIDRKPPPEIIEDESEDTVNCDVHGKHGAHRSSFDNILKVTQKQHVFQHNFGHSRRGSVPTINNNNNNNNHYRYVWENVFVVFVII